MGMVWQLWYNGLRAFFLSGPNSCKWCRTTGRLMIAEIMSATGWAISMPVIPRNAGSIRISGMKTIPERREARIRASRAFPMLCRSILELTEVACIRDAAATHRSATEPIAMTSGSFLNHRITGSAKINANPPIKHRIMVPTISTKRQDFFTIFFHKSSTLVNVEIYKKMQCNQKKVNYFIIILLRGLELDPVLRLWQLDSDQRRTYP